MLGNRPSTQTRNQGIVRRTGLTLKKLVQKLESFEKKIESGEKVLSIVRDKSELRTTKEEIAFTPSKLTPASPSPSDGFNSENLNGQFINSWKIPSTPLSMSPEYITKMNTFKYLIHRVGIVDSIAEEYARLFVDNGFEFEQVAELDHGVLEAMGVKALGHR